MHNLKGCFFIIILKGLLIAKSINDQSDNRRNVVNGVKLIFQQSFDRVIIRTGKCEYNMIQRNLQG